MKTLLSFPLIFILYIKRSLILIRQKNTKEVELTCDLYHSAVHLVLDVWRSHVELSPR